MTFLSYVFTWIAHSKGLKKALEVLGFALIITIIVGVVVAYLSIPVWFLTHHVNHTHWTWYTIWTGYVLTALFVGVIFAGIMEDN